MKGGLSRGEKEEEGRRRSRTEGKKLTKDIYFYCCVPFLQQVIIWFHSFFSYE
jgi:hypothetical protein